MQQFECPFCGLREQTEFTYVRETAAVPALDADAADWQRYVYQRDNPAGPHSEWWHHHHGCRQMLVIVRDTLSHAVLQIAPARPAVPQPVPPIPPPPPAPQLPESRSPERQRLPA